MKSIRFERWQTDECGSFPIGPNTLTFHQRNSRLLEFRIDFRALRRGSAALQRLLKRAATDHSVAQHRKSSDFHPARILAEELVVKRVIDESPEGAVA